NIDDIESDITTIDIEVKTVALTLSSENAIQAIGSEFTIDAVLSDESFSIPVDASWQITVKPDGSASPLRVDGSSVSITPDVVGTYTISLSFEIDGVTFNATQTIVVNDDVIDEADTVHGVVTGLNDEILEGAKVRLYNADDISLYDLTVTTDETGSYIFSELPAGRYYLVVSGGNGYINQTQTIIIN
ncbi:MAG TPA: carboxypeptidase regulatory-like domain-containing protein, partial [Campylobacterales bacterium]|nr:carboxypeptidase regulatory-like domain-containing protein [Campylobacterales bacterium]